jgi:hypothetical protein
MAKPRKRGPIPYHTENIVGKEYASAVASELVIRGAYFKMEPMLDDIYRFTVKPENKRWLLFYKAVNPNLKEEKE